MAFRAAATTFSVVNPNFFCKSLIGADAPNRAHSYHDAGRAHILRPAEGGGLLHRDPRFHIRRQNLGFVLVALMLKEIPRRHADHAGFHAFGLQLLVGADAQRNFAAGAHQDDFRLAVGCIGQDVRAFGDA